MRANNRNIFVEVDSAGGDYVTSGSFNTSTGEVTLTRLSGGTIVYNLDGRYLTGFTDTFVTGSTFDTGTGILEFTNTSGGTFNVDLDNRYSLTGHTHNLSDLNNDSGFINGIIIEEFDGSPSVSGVTKIVISGGTVTDDGGGQVTIQTGSGGGGGSGSGITWEVVTGNTSCSGSTGYIANSASLIIFTLPTTNVIETIRITGKGVGGWQVDVPNTWTINFAGENITDNLQSNETSDSIELLCIGNNTYQVISSIGNITFNNL